MGYWHFDTDSFKKVISWGKYKNCTLEYVLETDHDYIKWLTENSNISFSPEVAYIIEHMGIVKKVKNVKRVIKKSKIKALAPKEEMKISFEKSEKEAKRLLNSSEIGKWTRILFNTHGFNMIEIYETDLEEGVLKLYVERVKDKDTMKWRNPKFKALIVIKKEERKFEKEIKCNAKDNWYKLWEHINKRTLEDKKINKNKQESKRICGLAFTDIIVLTNATKCYKNHLVEDVVAIFNVIDIDGKYYQEKVAAAYCKECDVFFLLKKDFKLLKKDRILLHRIITEQNFISGDYLIKDYKFDLAEESPLHICGYNVDGKKNLSFIQRCIILEHIVDSKILTKSQIISYLDYFISQGEKKSSMENAVNKWKTDRAYIKEYNINSAKHILVDKIIENKYIDKKRIHK